MEHQAVKTKNSNMFRGVTGRSGLNSSQKLRDNLKSVPGSVRMYEQRAMEMKPLNLKRPINESPNKVLRRKDSDVSLPPSFRINDETQQ